MKVTFTGKVSAFCEKSNGFELWEFELDGNEQPKRGNKVVQIIKKKIK